MALTNQPYLPLYIDDWMNNSKLKMCTPAAHGVMISIMCILHKEVTYGKLLLKQKFKQNDKQIKNFASQLAKLTAFEFAEIENPLVELVSEGVLIIDEDYLICKRMVRDAEISEKRSNAGFKGGASNKNKNFAYTKSEANSEAKPIANTQANSEANTVIVNESVIVIENESKNENVAVIEKTENEKIDFEKVIAIFNSVCNKLPAVQKLTPQRKSSLKNRISEVGLKGIGDVFQKVSLSNFLTGENDRGWTADFDWILKPANFQKILEDKYKNKVNNGNGTSASSFKTVSDDFARKVAEGLQSQ
jgi:hypothetical protein